MWRRFGPSQSGETLREACEDSNWAVAGRSGPEERKGGREASAKEERNEGSDEEAKSLVDGITPRSSESSDTLTESVSGVSQGDAADQELLFSALLGAREARNPLPPWPGRDTESGFGLGPGVLAVPAAPEAPLRAAASWDEAPGPTDSETSDSEADTVDPLRLSVLVSRPCDVTALIKARLCRWDQIRPFAPPEWADEELPRASEAAGDQAYLQHAFRVAKPVVRYSVANLPGIARAFRDSTEEELAATFQSFLDAVAIQVEWGAVFRPVAWRALARTLPCYGKLRSLELGEVDMHAPELAALVKAVARCPGLEKLSLDVYGEDLEVAVDLPEMPKLQRLFLGAAVFGALERAGDWLPRLPQLRLLTCSFTADNNVQAAYDGLKRGILRSIEGHGMLRMRRLETALVDYEEAEPPRGMRVRLVDPDRNCLLRLRPEDYAYAASRGSFAAIPGRLPAGCETSSVIDPPLFGALRYRQWAKHAVLHAFLHAGRVSAPERAHGAVGKRAPGKIPPFEATVRRTAQLPKELWCQVLEWWGGGRIHLGSARTPARKRLRSEDPEVSGAKAPFLAAPMDAS